MTRSTSTGLYTRLSNSFSQPVTGTTIDPTDADSYFDDIDEAMNSWIGTSTTSVAIGTGAQTFTTQLTKAFIAGTFVQIFSQANHANYMYGTVTSYTAATGALVVDVVTVGGSGTLTDWLILSSGARGGTGATGATGREAGINYKWNSSTSAGDPGTGKILISDAGTVLNISETDDDGNSLSAIIATYDDSTTTTNRGSFYIMKTGGVGLKVFKITSAITDNGTYDSFTGTVTTVGSFSDNDECFCYFIPTGDKGADGVGTGDVVGPSSSVDSEIALFNSTTGKLIKRASTTGILKGTSGVLSAASAGTDYIAPSGALGTPSSGTLTNCTGLPVAGITASTSTALGVGSIELGHASDTTLSRSAAGIVAVEGVVMKNTGKETIWIPASAMISRTTNGAAAGSVEQTTNKNMVKSLDFDTTTQEFAQFSVAFPKSWNLGTVTFIPYLSQLTTAAGNVVFGLAGVAVSTTDALDVAFGTAQTSDTTVGTANLEYVGPESSAITIAGTPAVGDRVMFQINRTVASDNLAQDARLHGIRLFFTTSSATDA